ncbi:hypothetical protein GEMRC1_001668 [Eukaryota sp. GEM-RC1]
MINEVEQSMISDKKVISDLERTIKSRAGQNLDDFKEVYEMLNTELQDSKNQKTLIVVGIENLQDQVNRKTQESQESSRKIDELSENLNSVVTQGKDIKAQILKIVEELEIHSAQYDLKKANLAQLQAEFEVIEEQLDDHQRAVKEIEREVNNIVSQIEITISTIRKIQSKMSAFEADFREARDSMYSNEQIPEQIETVSPEATAKELKKLENVLTIDIQKNRALLEESKIDIRVLNEFKSAVKETQGYHQEYVNASEHRNSLSTRLESLKKQRLIKFMTGFTDICHTLREIYQMVTFGGDAELELVDSLDPFSEGIVFSVRPPRKSWKNISNLSGGEKTLSSLSLIFALHAFKKNPIYVLDEIDAALDFKNVGIIAAYLTKKTRDAQFIVISLRNNMFEKADRLVGIYKISDMTQSVVFDPLKLLTGHEQVEENMQG